MICYVVDFVWNDNYDDDYDNYHNNDYGCYSIRRRWWIIRIVIGSSKISLKSINKSMEEQVRQNSATYTLKIDSHDLNIMIMMILIVMVMGIVVKVIIVIVMMMLTVDTHVSYNKCVNSSKVACRKQTS